MILTAEELKKRDACKEGIDFFEINFPEGLDLDKFKIEGEYREGWVEWVNKSMKYQYEYNDYGNIIKKILPDGEIYQYE